jgi:hypothetical protein
VTSTLAQLFGFFLGLGTDAHAAHPPHMAVQSQSHHERQASSPGGAQPAAQRDANADGSAPHTSVGSAGRDTVG